MTPDSTLGNFRNQQEPPQSFSSAKGKQIEWTSYTLYFNHDMKLRYILMSNQKHKNRHETIKAMKEILILLILQSQ